jgi:replication-associated recombination protein RarA
MSGTKMKSDWQSTKNGYNFYEVLSAMQKAVRRGDAASAGYWALELYDSGFIVHIWNRLHIIACEDIAEPISREISELERIHDRFNEGTKKGTQRPGRLMVAKAIILLAAAKKSRAADHLICCVYETSWIPAEKLVKEIDAAKSDVAGLKKEIPDYALDGIHTKRVPRGRKKMTRQEFLRTEHEALNPRIDHELDEAVPVITEVEPGQVQLLDSDLNVIV